MAKSTTIVTFNVFRSFRLFREGSSNMVLFFLLHGTLRTNMTNHTTMVASMNKLRSIQIFRLRPKQRFSLKSLSLHFMNSFVWRYACQFVFRGRTHNRHKFGFHNKIATITSSFLAIDSAIKHLACILSVSFSHFKSSTSFLDKTSVHAS